MEKEFNSINSQSTGSAGASDTAEITSVDLQQVWEGHYSLSRISTLRQFLQHCSRALFNIRKSISLSLLCVFTAFLALMLLCLMAMLFQNINNYLENIGSSQSASLFLKNDLAESEVVSLQGLLKARPELSSVEYVSAEQALELFRKSLGENAGMLDGLEQENPLPASIEIKIKTYDLEAAELDRMIAELKQLKGVEQVRYSRGLLQDFGKIFKFLNFAGTVAVVLLLLVTAVIVSNTISLAIFSYREEIRIMRLLGARASFMRAPFLIAGALIGFIAGLLAIGTARLSFYFLESSWPQVLQASQLFPAPVFVGNGVLCVVVLIGIFVGWLGAFVGSRVYSTL